MDIAWRFFLKGVQKVCDTIDSCHPLKKLQNPGVGVWLITSAAYLLYYDSKTEAGIELFMEVKKLLEIPNVLKQADQENSKAIRPQYER